MNSFSVSSGNLYVDQPIPSWDEAFPLGNGFCGVLIWGPSRALRFSLDRGDLWDATPCSLIHDPEFTYPNMVKLAREGNIGEINRLFDAPYKYVLPSKLPAGKLIFDFGEELPQFGCLDLETAQAELTVGKIPVHSFVHAGKHLGMIRLGCRRDAFDITLQNPSFGLDTENADDGAEGEAYQSSLKKLKYPAPVCNKTKNNLWFTQKVGCSVEYGIFAEIRDWGGETQIAWAIGSSEDGEGWQETARSLLSHALDAGYEAEFAEHCRWWTDFWAQGRINVPDPLFSKNWYLTQYLLGSCSRKGCYPMPLQGVWTEDADCLPPWKGDYHNDLNTQMCYMPYMKAGHFPEGESFLDFLWNLRECGRKFARDFYKTPGLCLPGTMTQNGDALGGWGMYSLSPTNQLWLCQSFERHWRFTGDRDFLKNRAYPYLSDTADMIIHLLEEKDGKLYLPISSSPEIHDNTLAAFLTPNSNYDLAMMRYLFTALIAMSRELGDGKEGYWQEYLRKLPDLAVDQDVLMICPDERLTVSHRHFSHMIAIYPLRLLNYHKPEDRKVIDASIQDIERLGTGFWTGYSYTWFAEMYAVARNGNGAAFQLEVFWRHFCSPNGFHLNGDYAHHGTSGGHERIFTLEGNMCAADALQEMLLQTEDGTVQLFPAIPTEWAKKPVAFRNFRGEKGLTVSAGWQDGVVSLTLSASQDCRVRILRQKGLDRILPDAEFDADGWTTLELKAGETRSFGESL